MLARVLFISDLHKRYKDSTSIKGQLEVQQKIQEDIINFNKSYGVTHNIILGDWYDRGFHGLGQAFGAIEMDRRISESVNGNVYLCVGNHFYLERDENPEMYIMKNTTWTRRMLIM
jgi:metallophosphoesterase superfamily enzyme